MISTKFIGVSAASALFLVFAATLLPRFVTHVYCSKSQREDEQRYQEYISTLPEHSGYVAGTIVEYNSFCYVGGGCYVKLDNGTTVFTRSEGDLPTCSDRYSTPRAWGQVEGLTFTDADIGKFVEVFGFKHSTTNPAVYTLNGSADFYIRAKIDR